MTIVRSVNERIRTALILLSGVIPFALQPGQLAGEPIAARQVDRLLDEFPDGGEGDIPQEVVLQCQLISLVSDALTLRASDPTTPTVHVPAIPASSRYVRVEYPALVVAPLRVDGVRPSPPGLTDEQPQGP